MAKKKTRIKTSRKPLKTKPKALKTLKKSKQNAKPKVKKPVVAKAMPVKSIKTQPVVPSKVVDKKETPPKKEPVLSKAKLKIKAQQVKAIVSVLVAEATVDEVVLTNAEGKRYCKVSDCDELATSDVYCRFHYLANWKKIQLRKRILDGGKLERYIEELTNRYPDKYLEIIRKDLSTDKDFLAAIQEMEIDESTEDTEFEDESRNYIEEVRGATVPAGGGGGREDEDF